MKIGLYLTSAHAMDLYRTIVPYKRIKDNDKSIELYLFTENNVTWSDLYMCDIVQIKPNGTEFNLKLIKECKFFNKKIILDLDDNLHRVNKDNHAHEHFSKQETLDNLKECFELADYVIFSTPHLQAFYKELYPWIKSSIIYNSFIPDVHKLNEIREYQKPISFLWRGSAHHLNDLGTISDTIKDIIKDKELGMVIAGLDNIVTNHLYEGAYSIKWSNNLIDYFKLINDVRPHYGLFPLTDTDFNQSKSNIFAIELLSAGSVVLAPYLIDQFNIPGVIRYENELHLKEIIADAKSDKIDRFKIVNEGRDYITKILHIDMQNIERLNILKNL